jgi:hypothetical protein
MPNEDRVGQWLSSLSHDHTYVDGCSRRLPSIGAVLTLRNGRRAGAITEPESPPCRIAAQVEGTMRLSSGFSVTLELIDWLPGG